MSSESSSQSIELAKDLVEHGIIQVNPNQPIEFKSGCLSPIYGDLRKINSYIELRKRVLKQLEEALSSNYSGAEGLCGVASGALMMAGALADRANLSGMYYREAKGYGTKKEIEGILTLDQRIVVIEDVISTGGSALKAVESLRTNGGEVIGVLAIYNHMFRQSKQEFGDVNCELVSLTNFHTVITAAREYNLVPESDLVEVEKWHTDPFAWRR